jgi:hypothetical protein
VAEGEGEEDPLTAVGEGEEKAAAVSAKVKGTLR